MIRLCETCASDMRNGEFVTCPPTVLVKLQQFLELFEAMFGACDWSVTLANLQDDTGNLIDPRGTFLVPGVADESSNWANRGALLGAYRELNSELAKGQFSVWCRAGMQ